MALSAVVIGGGTSGLCSAKYAIAEGYSVTVYEQTENLGGLWCYTDETGKDKYGISIQSAAYQALRANSPYQLMQFSDHQYPTGTQSYPSHADILAYLDSYADRFDLKKCVRFSHLVIRVHPTANDKWEVVVNDLTNNSLRIEVYDVVFVCTGHYSTPHIPDIDGTDEFKGKMIHSHDFRKADAFHGDSILVIGAGASGRDLVDILSKTAASIIWSQHKKLGETEEMRMQRQSLLPPNVRLQDDVKRFTRTGAEFVDNSHHTINVVFFAAGYNYSYPFLSSDCGIHVNDNFVEPLYKQIFNIQRPSMAFIGVTTNTSFVCELEVRFVMEFLSGRRNLPSKSEMMIDMQTQAQMHWNKGFPKRRTHIIYHDPKSYFQQLSETADIENVPEVLFGIFSDVARMTSLEPYGYRKFRYTIVDDKTFTREKCDN